MTKSETVSGAANGSVLFIPLNKLKKSPRNARKMAHGDTHIEALAASIAAHGLLQSPVVEAERNTQDALTGFYLVTIGEGRRLAQCLRAKRKEIAKTEPIRCIVESAHDAFEVSLAENAVRSPMHPADQFEAFHALSTEQGLSAEDIAGRFGVTAAVVKQRLKLAAVSPVLIEAYRNGELNLDQLSAYAITEDHGRQEAVFEDTGKHADREDILRALNDENVDANDRLVAFVGLDAYQAAGGSVLRDLFDTDHEGYLTDAALLYKLAQQKLDAAASELKAEGWKWVETMLRYDYSVPAKMRRVYPEATALSDEAQSRIDVLHAEYEALEAEGSDDFRDDAERIEKEIEALRGEEAFRAADIARSGAFVTLGYDGKLRIERGFVKPEDDDRKAKETKSRKAADGGAPLSEKLVSELTGHRTMALRNAVASKPEVALTMAVHALALHTFHPYAAEVSCLKVAIKTPYLGSLVPAIDDTAAGMEGATRHEDWAKRVPETPEGLWDFVQSLDPTERLALFAHCVSFGVDTIEGKQQRSEAEQHHARQVARATGLDMSAHWSPTVESYLGRVSKDRILDAVREGVSKEAADNIASMKKQAMAEVAEQRLQGRGWLPPILRSQETALV